MPKKKCPFCNEDLYVFKYCRRRGQTVARIYRCPNCGILHFDVVKQEWIKGPYVERSKLLEKWQKEGLALKAVQLREVQKR